MAIWFWLNIPAMVVVFSAIVGIPTWLVLRWPDEEREGPRRSSARQSRPSTSRPEREREVQLTH